MNGTTVYARYVAYAGDGGKREFRLEIRGDTNTLYAVTDNGNEKNHGGRVSWDDAIANAEYWMKQYEASPLFAEIGFMRVVDAVPGS